MTTHELKVVPPYFDSLVAGSKTFEVRRNDRGFQRGDVLRLREWHPYAGGTMTRCEEEGCDGWTTEAHWATCRETVIRTVGFVFSGDPRFGGIEPGHVVLSLLSEHAKPVGGSDTQPDDDIRSELERRIAADDGRRFTLSEVESELGTATPADQPEQECAYCGELESNCTGSGHGFLPVGPMRA